MINSTWECERADAWSLMRPLARLLIITKHMLSLRVPEPHQLERGLCWANPSGAFTTRDEYRARYARRLCVHVPVQCDAMLGLIKATTMHSKSQTHYGIRRLNLPRGRSKKKKQALRLLLKKHKLCLHGVRSAAQHQPVVCFFNLVTLELNQLCRTVSSKRRPPFAPHAGFQSKN